MILLEHVITHEFMYNYEYNILFFLFNNLKNNYCTSKLIILAVFVLLIK